MLHASADLWRLNGVDVHVLACADHEGPFAEALRARGIVVHRISWSRCFRHLPAFWRLLKREKYDAVHLQTYRGYLSFACTARLVGVKHLVYTTHSIFVPRGWMRRQWQFGRRRVAKALGVRFVAVGKSVQDNEKRMYGLDTKLIWNWSDATRFEAISAEERAQSRSHLGIAAEHLVMISVGNCCGRTAQQTKNHRLILEGLASLTPDLRARVIYLHIGEEDPAQDERRLAAKLGITTNVKFMGAQLDVRTFLSAADFFAMSSLYEGLGVAAIEAALCGLPLLLTDVPGLRDFRTVFHNECFVTGLAVPEMAQTLEHIVRLPTVELKGVGRRSMRLAEAAFSMEQGVARYISLYKGNT